MKFWEFMTEDNENRFLTVLSDILRSHFFKVMDHAEEYNELTKRIQALDKERLEAANEEEAEGHYEEYEELLLIKSRLDARTVPDEEDEDEDYTSIRYSTKICIRVLRFLQLLCENHNLKLQDHLREQNNKDGITLGKNFDFPTFISNMLGVFSKHANIHTMELGGMLIDALIEFIQGPCHGNQKALISAKIIDNCRDFIAGYQENGYETEMKSKGFDLEDSEHLDMINETKQKLTTLLLALLEGIPDSFVINRMSQSLDFTMMKNRMFYVYKNFVIDLMNIKKPKDETIVNIPVSTVNNNLKLDSLEDAVLEGFDIYILLNTLS